MPVVLDPHDVAYATGSAGVRVSEPLPRAVREFGYIPDINLWQPGDLLLFSSIKPNWIKKGITRVQGRGWDANHARWHHAAVYIGRARVCEATITGVAVGSVYKYVPDYLIRVRRCPLFLGNPVGAYDIAIAALTRLNRWYSLISVVSVWWKMASGLLKLDFAATATRAHICSHLYADSYSQATKRVLENGGTPTPAALSASMDLEDVDSQWKCL